MQRYAGGDERLHLLPFVLIGDLTGLLEHLSGRERSHADIYLPPERWGVDSKGVLRLIEAAKVLGFVHVALTPLGDAFADASILARKSIFAVRIRRLPILNWLTTMLHH